MVCAICLVTLVAGCSSDPEPDQASVKPSIDLDFYVWDENLLGPGAILDSDYGGPPPGTDPERVAESQRKKWIAAGRIPARGGNRQLIAQGAEPSRRDALDLADREEQAGNAPQGTLVVAEQAIDGNGDFLPGKRNTGFYALNDDPSLTVEEIVNPSQGLDLDGHPNVNFGFTKAGQQAFEEMTRQMAREDLKESRSGPQLAILRPSSFIVVSGGLVLSRTFVDFTEYPDGIDGRTGFQIEGGFDIAGAQKFARALGAQGN